MFQSVRCPLLWTEALWPTAITPLKLLPWFHVSPRTPDKFWHLHQCCQGCVQCGLISVAREATSGFRVYACQIVWCDKLVNDYLQILLEGFALSDSDTLWQIKDEEHHCSSTSRWILSFQLQQISQYWWLGAKGISYSRDQLLLFAWLSQMKRPSLTNQLRALQNGPVSSSYYKTSHPFT